MRWGGEKILQPDPPHVRKGQEVYICAFRVVDDFVLFSLHQKEKGVLEFPRATMAKAVSVIGKDWYPQYVGHLTWGEEVYAWYECRVTEEYAARFVKKEESQWWALSSEIVNWNAVLHFTVAPSAVDLFYEHSELLFVESPTGEPYECPMVAYYGAYYTKILKLAIVGPPRSEVGWSSLGPYFYFGDYASGMKYAFTPMSKEREMYHSGEKIVGPNGVFTRGGIARFALKVGEAHTMLLGRRTDRSENTRRGIREGIVRPEDARYRDSDGTWASEFDAVFLGRRTVMSRSAGKEKLLNPQYVVKKFHQHVPLSYHYVDTASQTAENAVIE